jgi:hypothetical protein
LKYPPKAGEDRDIELSEKRKPNEFRSVTQNFIRLSKEKLITCPKCGKSIDFQLGVNWHGPTSFSCNACNKLLHMSYVTRQLEKMGLLDAVFLR